MTHPEALRHSLALSREEGAPFPVAWEIATTEHPLEDFMEGYFNEGRDSEGNDFAEWLRNVWEGAYDSKPFSAKQKPTRLEPRNVYAEGLRSLPVASEGHDDKLKTSRSARGGGGGDVIAPLYEGTDRERPPERFESGTSSPPRSKRCKSGDRCDRVGGHGITGRFCEHHAGELARIRKVHGLDEAFDWDEFSSKTYQAAFG